jgi:hypothetical protein
MTFHGVCRGYGSLWAIRAQKMNVNIFDKNRLSCRDVIPDRKMVPYTYYYYGMAFGGDLTAAFTGTQRAPLQAETRARSISMGSGTSFRPIRTTGPCLNVSRISLYCGTNSRSHAAGTAGDDKTGRMPAYEWHDPKRTAGP